MTGNTIASLSGIEVRYRNLRRPALSGASLTIEADEVVAITGPSGSGKSSLLSVLGLLTRPASGTYVFNGVDVSTASDRERATLRAHNIGFVFQAYHLLRHLTILENVLLGVRYGPPVTCPEMHALDLLARFGLEDRHAAMPEELSGGEQQRVAIARALIARPEIVLCDEPTGNLDRKSGERVLDAILASRDEGRRTTVLVTHDAWVAAHADRTIELDLPR